MTITVKLLRAAGLSSEQIARVCELEEDERRALRRARNARHRNSNRLKSHISADERDVSSVSKRLTEPNHLKNNKTTDARDVSRVSQERFPHTPSKEVFSSSPTNKLSEEQEPLPLSLEEVFLTTPRARTRSKLRANGHAHSDFEDFWLAYPNKVGKAAARSSFERALKRATIEVIADGLRRYCDKTDDRPWCHPSTWLNQDRWLDEPALPPPKRKSPQQESRDEVRRVADEMIREARERNAKRA